MFRCLFSKHARVLSTAVVMFNKLVVIFWLNVLLKLSIDRMMNKKPFEIYIVYVDISVSMNCYLLILFVYKTQLMYHRGEVVSRVAKFKTILYT